MSRDSRTNSVVVPPAVIQDTLNPYKLEQWELAFLSRSDPAVPLGETANHPDVRRVMPFEAKSRVDDAVQKLLQRSLDMLAVVMLTKPKE